MAISKYFQGKHKENLLIGILIIFYTVGTVGILLPDFRNQFLALSFFNLLLSTVVVLFARKKDFLKFLFAKKFLLYKARLFLYLTFSKF